MPENDLIQKVTAELQKFDLIILTETKTFDQLHAALSGKISHLIDNNFSLLISVLYRLDISEEKLKLLLTKSQGISSGDIIAKLIVERQLQKIRSKESFKNNHFSDEERW